MREHTNDNGNAAGNSYAPFSGSTFSFGDVFFRPRIRKPREMYLGDGLTAGEDGGQGFIDGQEMMTIEEWHAWMNGRDDLTYRELCEAVTAAYFEFEEPQDWKDLRKRQAETGTPFLD